MLPTVWNSCSRTIPGGRAYPTTCRNDGFLAFRLSPFALFFMTQETKYTTKQKRMLRFLAAAHKVTLDEVELLIVRQRLDELEADLHRDDGGEVVPFPFGGGGDGC